mgnify:CR=1 FL=1
MGVKNDNKTIENNIDGLKETITITENPIYTTTVSSFSL